MRIANLDDKPSTKIRQKLIFMAFAFLIFIIGNPLFAKEDWRCGIRLVFDSDGKGSVANYVLGLQVKNTTGRDINGISVIYKDRQNSIIGNAFLNCSVNAKGVKPGS